LLTDSSGNGNGGSYINTPTLGAKGVAPGDADTAVAFDAAFSQYALMGVIDTGTTYSVEAWFRQDYVDRAANQVIVGRMDPVDGSWEDPWGIELNSGAVQFYMGRPGASTIILTCGTGSTTATFSDGQWHHAALVVTNNTMQIYVDGYLRQSQTGTPWTDAVTPVTIGAGSDPSNYFTGRIDEVAVYGVALSAQDVRDRWDAGRRGSYQYEVLADRPLAWWPLGESSGTLAKDASGADRHATYTGSPTLGAAALLAAGADSGAAATFNGSSQYVRLAAASWMNTASVTVAAWVSTTATDARGLVTRWDGGSTTQQVWGLDISATGNVRFYVRAGGTTVTIGDTTSISDGQPHHIVGVRDAATNTVTLYIDGVRNATATATGLLTSTTSDLGILVAARENGSGYALYLPGTVDEVAFFGRALDDARVLAHYKAGRAEALQVVRLRPARLDLAAPPAGLGPQSVNLRPAVLDLTAPPVFRRSWYAQEVLNDGPSAYWDMSTLPAGRIVDRSGNQRALTPTLAPTSVASLLPTQTDKALATVAGSGGVSGDFGSWATVDTVTGSVPGGTVVGLAYDGFRYIVAFTSGRRSTSTEYTIPTWNDSQISTIPQAAPWRTLVWDNGYVMLGGDDNRYAYATSMSASIVENVPPAGAAWLACRYNGTIAVIAGTNGLLCTASNPASTWTARTSTFGTTTIRGLAYGSSLWVAVGDEGKVATSSDAATWTARAAAAGSDALRAVAHSGGLWVAVGDRGCMIASTSPTTSWFRLASPFGTSTVRALYVRDGFWVAAGDGGKVAVSTDGRAWTLATTTFQSTDSVVALGGSTAAVVAVSATGKIVKISRQAADWAASGSFTVEAWIKPTSTSGYLVHRDRTNGAQFRLWLSSGTAWFTVYKADQASVSATSTAPIVAGQTYHVVGTYDSATGVARVYVNGVVGATAPTLGSTLTTSALPVFVGRADGDATSHYSGVIDDVSVYPSRLSDARILAHYLYGSLTMSPAMKPGVLNLAAPPAIGGSDYYTAVKRNKPRVWWRLGESSGTTAADSGSRANLPGTYSNVTLGVAGAVGDSDTAASFPDASLVRRISRTGLSLTAGTAVAVEVWFKTTATSGAILHVTNQFMLTIDSGGHLVATKRNSSDAVLSTITSISVVNDNEWHQAAIVYRHGGTYQTFLYIDGSLDSASAAQFTNAGTGGAIYVGQNSTSTSQFVGAIDEFSVWGDGYSADNALMLDDADIPVHYQAAGYAFGTSENLAPAVLDLTAPTFQAIGAVAELAPAVLDLTAPRMSVEVPLRPAVLDLTAPSLFSYSAVTLPALTLAFGGDDAAVTASDVTREALAPIPATGAFVRLYSSTDDPLGDLTTYDELLVTQSRQVDSGALSITLPHTARNADLLSRDILFARLVAGGVEEQDVYVLDEDNDDDKDERGAARPITALFPSIEAWFQTAIVYPETAAPGETGVDVGGDGTVLGHRFNDANAGAVMKVLIDRARQRGALRRITYDFTATHDSNGVAWTAQDVFDEVYNVGTDLLQVLKALAGVGWCEYRFDGFMLRLFRRGTLGVDRPDVVLRVGREVQRAPRQKSRLATRTTMLVQGKDLAIYERRDNDAVQSLERREGFYQRSGVYQLGTISRLAETVLDAQKRSSEAVTLTLDAVGCPYQPNDDFSVWDFIYYDQRRISPDALEPLRVNTVTRRWDASGERVVEVEVLDRVADRNDRLLRLLERIYQPDAGAPVLPPPTPGIPPIPPSDNNDYWQEWQEQYNNWTGGSLGYGLVYVQPNEPLGVPVGTQWWDTDDYSV
jgi:hypothetical protein